MPTVYPIAWEPLAITGYYRNLQRRDLVTWERFLVKHARDFEAVAYDVAIGGVWPDDPALPEHERLGWKYTTALKIDALLKDVDGVWCCEVKPAVTTSAVGAALAYALLLGREEPDLDILGAASVAGHASADLKWVMDQLNVRYFEV